MKSRNYLLFIVLIAFSFLMMQCAKEGPMGPPGADGVDGQDANTTCLNCHSAATWGAIETAFAATKHASGTSWSYAGERGYCNYCHSADAFLAFVESGIDNGIISGAALKCNSCHDNHGNLEDSAIAELRVVNAAMSLINEGETYEHGTGNTCAQCHQARNYGSSYDNVSEDAQYERTFTGDDMAVYANAAVGPEGSVTTYGTDSIVVVFDVPTTHVYISSTHAGPHHGPQANVFAADVGYPIGTAFTRDFHTDCSGCHLNNAADFGHSFVPDITQCDACHGSAYDVSSVMSDISSRLDALQTALEGIHAIHVEDDGVHPMYASITRAQFQAFWNFMVIYEDQSMGVHNPDYVELMLSTAETTMGLK
jgi:hypothetical protein